jgi:prevent-host-death family protein
MISKNVTEAKAQLSALLESVERGEEIVITRGNRPIAKLVPLVNKKEDRIPGRFKGKIKISPDFDSLSPEIEDLFSLK